MKRPRPIPELEPPRRRTRVLSEEESALWESVAKQIKPLRKKPRSANAREGDDLPAAKPAMVAPSSSRSVKVAPVSKPNQPPSAPPLMRLGRRERSQLSRGRKEIEARLDLHGMTQTRAHRVLSDFLRRAHADGLTFVLVITGKGRSGESERGVLRRQVPQWLGLPEFRTLVVGFEEAHIGHGGEGALYVRIRRVRN
jgi:DNA-nicking Smr family endonuclease